MLNQNIDRWRYKDVRKDIKAGWMFFCVGNGVLSKGIIECSGNKHLILNGEKIIPSHIGSFDIHRKQLMALEAVGKVRLPRFSHAYINIEDKGEKYDGRIFVGRVKASRWKTGRAMNRMATKVGLDYDEHDIFIQLKNKLKIFGQTKHVPDEEFFCSELHNDAWNGKYGSYEQWVQPADIWIHPTTEILFEIIF